MYNPVDFDPGRDLASAAPYRTSTAFNSAFANANRSRQQPVQPGPAAFLRDTSNFAQHFSVDSFAHTQPSAQQHPPINDSFQPSHSAFDISLASQPSAAQAPGSGLFNKPAFNTDVFASGNASGMLPTHKTNGGLPGSAAQQSNVLGQQQSNGFPHTAPAPYMNGGGASHHSMQSQTPYGPHLPTANKAFPPSQLASTQAAAAQSSVQEEISTIFVVGFPDDMQEREFQNMFTFSPGFEAATLKIPNKEPSVYGQGGPANGFRQGMYGQTHGGPNDPYNLVTINQGGVVVDNGRDGTTSSWQPNDEPHFSHMLNGPNGAANNRKQIIGFAKFRTRAEALEARDTLQGRRVDIEKGAVLKAEMAKKNLHTKRGLGPLQLQNGGPVPADGAPTGNGPSGMAASDALPRDRELREFGSMSGLGGRRDARLDMRVEDELDMRKASIIGGGFARGARERAEEEDRRWKGADPVNSRARGSDALMYEAFHSVPSSQRPTGNSLMSTAGVEGVPVHRASVSASWGSAAPRKATLPSSLPQRPPSTGQQLQYSPPSHEDIYALGAFSPPLSGQSLPPHPSLPLRPRQFSPTRGEYSDSSDTSAGADEGRGPRGLAVNVPHPVAPSSGPATGQTSPQASSPSSDKSSNGRGGGAVDQNPPINTLYVGNLPSSPPPSGHAHSYLEESLRELFSQQPGFRKLCFRQKSNGPMCFVEFVDVNFAKKALDELYGATLNGIIKGGGIRLSYSKNPLGVRTPTNAQQQQPLAGPGSIFPIDAFQRGFAENEASYRHQRDSLVSPTSAGFSQYGMGMSSPPPRFVSPPPVGPSSIFAGPAPRQAPGGFSPPSSFSAFSLHNLPSNQSQHAFNTYTQIPEQEQIGPHSQQITPSTSSDSQQQQPQSPPASSA
ncbi:unnamed protein product [Peniophora sp. CBMAI 1063]|nr:unnamed protein product [Peniophora sp. CBMAI 1063]